MKTVVLLCSLMAVSSHAADKTGAAPFSSRTANVHTLTLLPGPTLTSPAGSTSRSFKWSSARPVTMSAARAAIGSSQAAGSKVPADIPPAPPANEPSFGSPPALDFRQKLPELKTTLQTRP